MTLAQAQGKSYDWHELAALLPNGKMVRGHYVRKDDSAGISAWRRRFLNTNVFSSISGYLEPDNNSPSILPYHADIDCLDDLEAAQASTITLCEMLMNRIPLSQDYLDIYFSGYGQGGPAATGQLDIFQYSTSTQFPDPDTSEWLCSEIPSDNTPEGVNWMALCDQDLDALFKLQATQVDFKERQQTFYKISKMIFDKVYMLGIYHDPDLWGTSARLQNVKLSGATPFYNIREWDLTQ